MATRRTLSVRGRQLARELREIREFLGLTGEDVAKALGWSSAKVSRIETAATPVKLPDLRKLLSLYKAPEDQQTRLIELARMADQRGWWDAFPNLRSDYATYVELEDAAHTIYSYSALVVPGLLQTEDYAHGVLSSMLTLPPGEVKRRVQIRMRRQQRLTREPPLEFYGVLDEAALLRQVGGPEVMRGQLAHLLELSKRPNIRLQILPLEAGAHPALTGGFIVLKVPEPGIDVVYIELMNSILYIEEEENVHQHTLVFDALRNQALPAEDTPGYLQQKISEIST